MTNSGQDKGALGNLADKAMDALGGVAGSVSAATAGSHSIDAFVENACVADLYEVEAGRLAVQRAQSDAVREFGAMMVEHHMTGMHQMQSALRSSEVTRQQAGVRPVQELDARRQGMIKHLQEAPEDEFDRTFVDQQKLAHRESLTLHEGYAENGDNPQLRSLALGAVPMIQRHSKLLDRIGVH